MTPITHVSRLALAAALAALCGHAAAIGTDFTYQGHLTDGGEPAQGAYDLRFTLLDGPDGDPVGTPQTLDDIPVSGGMFTVSLDFGDAAFSGAERFLRLEVRRGAEVGAYATLDPPSAIAPTPYAQVTASAEFAATVADLAVGKNQLADGAVSTAKIAGLAVTADKISGDAVTTIKIANGAVTTIKIANGAVTSAKIASNAIGTEQIDAAQVQRRVTGVCAGNNAIGQIAEDGSVTCVATGGAGAGWDLTGNADTTAGTNFIGTTDAVALEVRVNNLRALRVQPSTDATATNPVPNLVGGSAANTVSATARGSVIVAGGAAAGSDPAYVDVDRNTVSGNYNFIGSGYHNAINSGVANAIAGGRGNAVSGSNQFIGAGRDNSLLTGSSNVIGGGEINSMTTVGGTPSIWSVIGGGAQNQINGGQRAVIGGGLANQINAGLASIVGGSNHRVNAQYGGVGGGNNNAVNGEYGMVGGGGQNRANADYSTVSGGRSNVASGLNGFIGGGRNNLASGENSSVGGGLDNQALGYGNTVAGGFNNTANATQELPPGGNFVGSATVGGGRFNSATGLDSSVAGGHHNNASAVTSTVSGGGNNLAGAIDATVTGGNSNAASGEAATVSGGIKNCAGGLLSWAGGSNAKVRPGTAAQTHFACQNIANSPDPDGDEGTFIWADATTDELNPVVSTGPNQFLVRATGGVWFGTTSTPSVPIGRFINTSTGAYLSVGGSWTNSSDRNRKADIEAVDGVDVLARVLALPLSTWRYKVDGENLRHLGPMAQDFHAAFGLNGEDDTHIASVDADGVALAAIQGLNTKLEAEVSALREELAALRALLSERRK